MSGLSTSLVQPVAVSRDGSHEDTIEAAARASVAAFLVSQDDPVWGRWLYGGSFTKSVRRGKVPDLRRLDRWLDGEGSEVPFVQVAVGDALAYGFVPLTYEDFPKVLSALQVSDTNMTRGTEPVVAGFDMPGAHIALDESLTTGKGAAQACHALWMVLMAAKVLDRPVAEVWLHLMPTTDLGAHMGRAKAIEVVDAGKTEVAPHTRTAVGWHI